MIFKPKGTNASDLSHDYKDVYHCHTIATVIPLSCQSGKVSQSIFNPPMPLRGTIKAELFKPLKHHKSKADTTIKHL